MTTSTNSKTKDHKSFLVPESPYKTYAIQYYERGQQPVPANGKTLLARDVTGWNGRDISRADIQYFSEEHPSANVALRLPSDILGIDVDNYDGKVGAQTIAELEARLGPLPPTISSTSRDDGVSRIRLFRIPTGKRRWKNLQDVEMIHYGHRYVVVYPSVHPVTGKQYRWYDKDGNLLDGLPDFSQVAELPEEWLNELDQGEVGEVVALASDEKIEGWLSSALNGGTCSSMDWAAGSAVESLRKPEKSRHDTAVSVAGEIVQMMAHGHAGGLEALSKAEAAFVAELTKPGKGRVLRPAEAKAEWKSAVAYCVSQEMVEHDQPGTADPCTTTSVGGTPSAGPVRASKIDPNKEVPFVEGYEGFFPKGLVTLCAGFPKAGKSTMVRTVMAELSARGERVLLWTAEDPEGLTVQSLINQGADLNNVWIEVGSRPLSKDTLDRLEEFVSKNDIQHFVLDPLSSFPIEKGTNNETARQPLDRLADMGHQHGLTSYVIHHFNGDRGSGSFMQRIAGNQQIAASVRSAVGFGKATNKPELGFAMVFGFGNYSSVETTPPRGYTIKGEPGQVAVARWTGYSPKIKASDLVEPESTFQSGIKAARVWLREVLEESPKSVADLKDLAKEESKHFGWRTVVRAKADVAESPIAGKDYGTWYLKGTYSDRSLIGEGGPDSDQATGNLEEGGLL